MNQNQPRTHFDQAFQPAPHRFLARRAAGDEGQAGEARARGQEQIAMVRVDHRADLSDPGMVEKRQ